MENRLATKIPTSQKRPRMLTPEDIAVDISRPVRFVLQLIRRRELPAIRVGKKTFRIDADDYGAFKRARMVS